jgi:hypothetical protein
MSAVLFQIPMNLQLSRGKDMALIQQMMESNWGRVFFLSLQALSVLAMMAKGGSNNWQ